MTMLRNQDTFGSYMEWNDPPSIYCLSDILLFDLPLSLPWVLCEEMRVKSLPYCGNKLSTINDNIDELDCLDFVDILILHVGSIDIQGNSVIYCYAQIKKAIEKLKLKCRKAKICISCILPYTPEGNISQLDCAFDLMRSKVSYINSLLSELCENDHSLVFMDHKMLQNDNKQLSIYIVSKVEQFEYVYRSIESHVLKTLSSWQSCMECKAMECTLDTELEFEYKSMKDDQIWPTLNTVKFNEYHQTSEKPRFCESYVKVLKTSILDKKSLQTSQVKVPDLFGKKMKALKSPKKYSKFSKASSINRQNHSYKQMFRGQCSVQKVGLNYNNKNGTNTTNLGVSHINKVVTNTVEKHCNSFSNSQFKLPLSNKFSCLSTSCIENDFNDYEESDCDISQCSENTGFAKCKKSKRKRNKGRAKSSQNRLKLNTSNTLLKGRKSHSILPDGITTASVKSVNSHNDNPILTFTHGEGDFTFPVYVNNSSKCVLYSRFDKLSSHQILQIVGSLLGISNKILQLFINKRLNVFDREVLHTDILELNFGGLGGLPSDEHVSIDLNESNNNPKRSKTACYLSKYNKCDKIVDLTANRFMINDIHKCFNIDIVSSDLNASLGLCRQHYTAIQNVYESCTICALRVSKSQKRCRNLFIVPEEQMVSLKEYSTIENKDLRVNSLTGTKLCTQCRLKFREYVASKITLETPDVIENNQEDKSQTKSVKSMCYLYKYQKCNQIVERVSDKFSLVDLNNLFDIMEAAGNTAGLVGLCMQHYTSINNLYESCAICSVRAYKSAKLKRKLFVIEKENIELLKEYSVVKNIQLRVSSIINVKLCDQCKKDFLDYKCSTVSDDSSDDLTEQFHDANLTLHGIESKYINISHTCENKECTHFSCIESKQNKTILSLCKTFLDENVILLGDLFYYYIEQDPSCQCFSCDHQKGKFLKPKQLLKFLEQIFGVNLCSFTIKGQPIFGKMLRWKLHDIESTLLRKLYEFNCSKKSKKKYSNIKPSTQSTLEMSDTLVLEKAIQILRPKIKEMCKKVEEDDLNGILSLTSINFVEFVSQYSHPHLWNFLLKLTLTEREHNIIAKPNFNWDQHYLKRFYKNVANDNFFQRVLLLSVSNYIYSSAKARYPLHLLLSDVLDKYSKSSQNCLHIFNTFGICVSKDSLNRHITAVSKQVMENGPENGIDDTKFKVTTVDNINARIINKRVNCEDTHRGIDDTSLMLVIPRPKTIFVTEDELTDFGKNAKKCSQFQYEVFPCKEQDMSFYYAVCKFFIRDFRFENPDFQEKELQIATALKISLFEELEKHIEILPDLLTPYGNLFDILSYNVNAKEWGLKVLQGEILPNIPEFITLARITGHPVVIFEQNPITLDLTELFVIKGEFHKKTVPINLLLNTNGTFSMINTTSSNFLNYEKKENLIEVIQFKNVFFNSHNMPSLTDLCKSLFILNKDLSGSDTQKLTKKATRRSIEKSFLDERDAFKPIRFETLNREEFQNSLQNHDLSNLTIDDIIMESNEESSQFNKLHQELFNYTLCKYQLSQGNNLSNFPGIKIYYCEQNKQHTEVSEFVYLAVFELVSEKKESIIDILEHLRRKFKVGQVIKYLVVCGDAKLYDILVKVKIDYKDDYSWLCPFPGDWHTMVNYTKHIMKIYGPAGLYDLVTVFHRGALYNSVVNVTNFERTLNFMLQSWEAFYRNEINLYLELCKSTDDEKFSSIIGKISKAVSDLYKDLQVKDNDYREIRNLVEYLHLETSELGEKFNLFCVEMCKVDETFRFWHNFIHKDGLVLIGFYLAIRGANWDLRNFCLKQMAIFFNAGDSRYYRKLLPVHLKDLHTFPPSIIDHFKNGGFVASIKGNNFSSVAMDESHEMLINKDVKNIIAGYSHITVSAKLHYLTYRATTHKHLSEQIDPNKHTCVQKESSKSYIMVTEKNIACLLKKIKESSLHYKTLDIIKEIIPQHSLIFFVQYSSGEQADETNTVSQTTQNEIDTDNSNSQFEVTKLAHIFTNIHADPLQRADLLHFRENSSDKLKDYVSCFILKTKHSIKGVNSGIKKFHNFGVKKNRNRQLHLNATKTMSESIKRLKQNIIWAHQHNTDPGFVHPTEILPLAIADKDGNPYKNAKSKSIEFFRNSPDYEDCFIYGRIPINVKIDLVILEGMFMINTRPLDHNKTFIEYAQFLFKTWVGYWYSDISRQKIYELHVVFDFQDKIQVTPKYFERQNRDKGFEGIELSEINDGTVLPTNWANFLKNRTNKKLLVNYLCEHFIKLGEKIMGENESLYVSGGFEQQGIVKKVHYKDQSVVVSSLNNNHYEADLLVWLCAVKSSYDNVLIYSPDTDVLHIGLPLTQKYPNKTFIIQLKSSPTENKYINLTKLVSKLHDNIKLKSLNLQEIPDTIQALFIATGCDYVSFFKHHSKLNFLKTFFKYADFICGKNNGLETGISALDCSDNNHSLLSFYRLIGCEYFHGLHHTFDIEVTNPVDLYNSLNNDNDNIFDVHFNWLDKIRQSTFHHKVDEEKYLPSTEALKYHWKRSSWVGFVWRQSDQCIIQYPQLDQFGWQVNDNSLKITWDSIEAYSKHSVITRMHEKGCGCKVKGEKDGCNKRCGCRVKNERCHQACLCKGFCSNAPSDKSPQSMLNEMLLLEQNKNNSVDEDDLVQDFIQPCDSESSDESDSSIDSDIEFENENLMQNFELED